MVTREFHFSEGTSNKFWRITVDGVTQTVHFGRIGTAGQEQSKAFDSDAAVKAATDKLIAEKVKKGYVEVGGNGAVSTAPTPKPKPAAAVASAAVAPAKAVDDDVEEEPSDAPVKAAAPSAPADLVTVSRSIDLSEDDYVRACVRPREPKAKPQPKPFDLDSLLARMAKCESYGWLDFGKAQIAPSLTLEEATFWFRALSLQLAETHYIKNRMEYLTGKLKELRFDTPPSDEEIAKLWAEMTWRAPSELAICLYTILGLHRFVVLMFGAIKSGWLRPLPRITDGFQRFILPYLTADETEVVRSMLRAVYQDLGNQPDIDLLYVGACVGLSEEIAWRVDRWPDRRTSQTYWNELDHTRHVVFGVGVPSEIERHFRRLTFTVAPASLARMWLAATQYSGLDVIAETVLVCTEKSEAETLTRVLARVHAPEAVAPMLRLYHESKATRVAREWFDANPVHAAAGLIELAASNDPYARKAVDMLVDLSRRGSRPIIEAQLGVQPAEIADRLRPLVLVDEEAAHDPLDDSTTPDAIAQTAPRSVKARPGDPAPAELPAIVVHTADGARRLSDSQIVGLLSALLKATVADPPAYVEAVKSCADPRTLDAFAWALFERWLSDGASSKEKWQMTAIGFLGGDSCALKLAPMIRKWPGEAQHQRAVLGLECLRAIGTDTALMQINGIANKVPFKAIKQRAAECMDDIAKSRGMTRAQLEDRIVPDCDLDERGSRIFDFGPRRFRFVLSPEMKAMVKDDAGKVASDLPKPNSKDDAALSEAAVAEWKLLKKQVSEVAKIQAGRLEQAMVTGRRWSASEFDQLLVRHPLMINLVRLLLWGVYGDDGKLASTFRVTEDQTLANSADESVDLPDGARVGVVHPLQLASADASAWGEVFSDYEIIPPFPQLGRAIHHLEESEHDAVSLKRFAQKRLPCAAVVFGLDKLGWQRAQPADGGGFSEHTKPFYGANVTAVAQYDPGCAVGWIVEADPQRFDDVFFVPGIFLPGEMWPAHNKRLKWGDIDPVVVSEVLADLTSIYAKEK